MDFETLIAKVLEAHGCFVPAYRGGCIQDVELFAHNDTSHHLDLEGLKIGAGSSAAIQNQDVVERVREACIRGWFKLIPARTAKAVLSRAEPGRGAR